MKKITEGDYSANTARFAIVVARFNEFIVDGLQQGALETLTRHGVPLSNLSIFKVPGAFELPLVARRVARQREYDAIISLGAVIRGATPHFDYVASQCASGLARISLDEDIPVIFGVLTTNTIEEAIERAGSKSGNKGSDAAMTALEMVSLLRALE
ncbi:MAG: 6,7-dimethyl-8-ribityllumazine synthase [Gammaproteobacteria bacterium TMED1]|nr:MAG: 6,7-dimethyl-8-ribityllumazine synthase [Gammaproteobacteria bacterium TMED1]|tara:strand:+ start:21 stop:488 length:468 start_codon:yes stop_codon:yes gene_type:complete